MKNHYFRGITLIEYRESGEDVSIGEYRLSPERLGQYHPIPGGEADGGGRYCLNLEGRRRYSPIHPSQTHGNHIVIK